jgi:hypothetical protein
VSDPNADRVTLDSGEVVRVREVDEEATRQANYVTQYRYYPVVMSAAKTAVLDDQYLPHMTTFNAACGNVKAVIELSKLKQQEGLSIQATLLREIDAIFLDAGKANTASQLKNIATAYSQEKIKQRIQSMLGRVMN